MTAMMMGAVGECGYFVAEFGTEGIDGLGRGDWCDFHSVEVDGCIVVVVVVNTIDVYGHGRVFAVVVRRSIVHSLLLTLCGSFQFVCLDVENRLVVRGIEL
jgi:hypothetical protein